MLIILKFLKRTVAALENSIGDIRKEVTQIEESAIWVATFGFLLLLLVKGVAGLMANRQLEKQDTNSNSPHTKPNRT